LQREKKEKVQLPHSRLAKNGNRIRCGPPVTSSQFGHATKSMPLSNRPTQRKKKKKKKPVAAAQRGAGCGERCKLTVRSRLGSPCRAAAAAPHPCPRTISLRRKKSKLQIRAHLSAWSTCFSFFLRCNRVSQARNSSRPPTHQHAYRRLVRAFNRAHAAPSATHPTASRVVMGERGRRPPLWKPNMRPPALDGVRHAKMAVHSRSPQ